MRSSDKKPDDSSCDQGAGSRTIGRMSRSVLYQLLTKHLGRDVGEVIQEARTAGESWSDIEFRIRSATGVSVTYETLRTWYVALTTLEGN